MAQDIVQGLFGVDPDVLRSQRLNQLENSAFRMAQLDPFQRATMGMYQAGGMLGGAAAQGMGMVNPAEEQARMTEQAVSGIDPSNPDSILERAQQIQDPRLKMQLTMLAQQQRAALQEQALKRSQELANLHKAQSEASPIAKLNPKDYTPESWAEYIQTKDTSKLRAVTETGKPPSSVEEYKFARSEGYKGNYEQWKKDVARAGAAGGVTVKLPEQEKKFEGALGEAQAKALMEGRASADDAAQMIATNQIGRQILNKGMVTGFGADAIVGIGQALKQAGLDFGGDATANSQAYASIMAQNVGKLIKQFGAGTGLSDADREYATKMAGGLISVDEKAIRKVLEINDRAAKNVINLHNKRAEGVKTNIPLKVEIPAETGAWSIRPK